MATTQVRVQLSITLYLLTFSLSQLIYGPLSDRYGRRPISLLGLSIGLAGTVISLFAVNINVLIAGRLLQGLGLGAGATLARAIMRDVYTGYRLAIMGSWIPIGAAGFLAAAPAVGGYIEHYVGWRFDFLFLLLYILFGQVGIWYRFPETNRHLNPNALKPRIFFGNYYRLLRHSIFVGYASCGSLSFAGLASYFTVTPFLLQTVMGVTPVVYGWLAFLVAAALALGGYINTGLVSRYGPRNMLIVALAIMFFGGLSMLLSSFAWQNVASILVPMFIFTAGVGLSVPNVFAGAFSPFPKVAGTAGALYGGFQILGGALASGMMASLPTETSRPLALVLMSLSASGLFMQWWAHQSSPQPAQTETQAIL